MYFDAEKLQKLIDVAGGMAVVLDAYEGLHEHHLARSTVQTWLDGMTDPGINKLLRFMDVFGAPIEEVLSDGTPPLEEWYSIVSRSESRGPKPARGPYKSLEAARQAVVKFRLKHAVAAHTHLAKARTTIVGPFNTVTLARRARPSSTPRVEECWK